ncbi:MAG: Cobalamin biosynthesis protein CobIJ [Chroococcidiopsis cubana SAG 39.79]|nr:precorrin-2 C(20)-methyltransferase [Chroococcidiopsis cubana]MDZ4871763.1 Cobalamin biosynthesis protein CobIJ [Chroococcidiopsis cubana SAG 39.79]
MTTNDSSMANGILYGVSVGPGDPELITLKGLRSLQQAPVVAFPRGIQDKPGIAQQIIAPWLRSDQQQLPLDFPYVQDIEVLTKAWQLAAKQVWEYLQKGQDVAFACEGDISFYSTFTYLAQTLQQMYPAAVINYVPGVCSPMAAASALGLPLTVRQERLVVLPAIYNVNELESILDWAEVVVLMKVSSVYEQVWQVLQRKSLLQHSWIVERATLPNMVIYKDLAIARTYNYPTFLYSSSKSVVSD